MQPVWKLLACTLYCRNTLIWRMLGLLCLFSVGRFCLFRGTCVSWQSIVFWQYHVKILNGKFRATQEDITKTCVFLDEAHVSGQNNMFSTFFHAVLYVNFYGLTSWSDFQWLLEKLCACVSWRSKSSYYTGIILTPFFRELTEEVVFSKHLITCTFYHHRFLNLN